MASLLLFFIGITIAPRDLSPEQGVCVLHRHTIPALNSINLNTQDGQRAGGETEAQMVKSLPQGYTMSFMAEMKIKLSSPSPVPYPLDNAVSLVLYINFSYPSSPASIAFQSAGDPVGEDCAHW